MLGEGRVTTNFGRVDVVLLQGAIVACYGGGEDDQQLRMNGRGAICGCHCSMLWWGEGRVMTNFGGGGGRGAIAGCHCSVLWWGQGKKVSNNTTIASRGATASGVSPIQLSVWKESGEKKDYSKATAMQVSASTLAHLIPEKGVQEAIPSDVWELPCITILNIAKNADDAWGYKGCSICSKKVCAHAAAERTCYNMDVEVSDHSGNENVDTNDGSPAAKLWCGHARGRRE